MRVNNQQARKENLSQSVVFAFVSMLKVEHQNSAAASRHKLARNLVVTVTVGHGSCDFDRQTEHELEIGNGHTAVLR